MEILCNFCSKRYSKKPQGGQVAVVQNELQKPGLYDLRTVAEGLGSGCNFRPGACNGTDDDSFVSQQVFPLDFDNKTAESFITPEEVIDRAKKAGLPPSFGYPTHSATAEKIKFRMGWVTDRPVKGAERDHVMKAFMTLFIKQADRSCSNPSRIFYGGHSGLLYWDPEAVVSVDLLLSMPIDESLEAHGADRKRKGRTSRKAGGLAASNKSRVVELIRTHDAEGLKQCLNRERQVFDNSESFFWYLYRKVDFADLLGVEPGEAFNCLFHDDKSPSANIFRTRDSGVWLYYCYGCHTKLNIKQFIELVGDFDSEFQAIEFIKAAFNLEIRMTAWAIEQQANIDRIIDCIQRTDDEGFSALCPTASNNVRYAKDLYLRALTIAKGAIFPDKIERKNGSGQIVFGLSVRQLARESGRKSVGKVDAYLKCLLYHKMLELVPDEEVPEKMLRTAWEVRKKGQNPYCTTFYAIPSWVAQRLILIETAGKRWKQNGYRLKGVSYEMFYRGEGEEVAKSLYPQYGVKKRRGQADIVRKPTETADKRHEEVEGLILGMIESRGYATEQEVIALESNNKSLGEVQLKRSLKRVLDEHGLVKVRANNRLKDKYGIPGGQYSHPYIIVRREDNVL